MRSAIRGDFERLAERRGEQALMLAPDEAESPPDADVEPEHEPPEAPKPLEPERPRRSWLSRLLSP
jgi:hypothetical protein